MLSSRLRRNKNLVLLRIVSILLILVIIGFIAIDCRLRPLLYDYVQSQAKGYALKAINQSVSQIVKDNRSDFDAVVSKTFDKEGRIVSLSTNPSAVDKIATDIFLRSHKYLSQNSGQVCSVDLGTLSGSPLLYGKGPNLKIHIKMSRYINYEIISGFTEAGINQTKNTLYLKLTTNIQTIIPGQNHTETISTKVLLAETVIVGTVPDGYTEVIQVGSSEFDTVDTLTNFGQ